MDSLAGEQLPLTSFFGRAASSSAAAARKPLKKKKDLAPPARKLGKQSKLSAVPTPPPTASGSSSRDAEKEMSKTAAKATRAPKQVNAMATTQTKNTRSFKPSTTSASRKRPLPTAIQPMTPALSSPSVRRAAARDDNGEGSSSLTSLSPSSTSSVHSSPAKKRRVEHSALTPAALQPRQLPTPRTTTRALPEDRLRHALRFKTPPPELFDTSQSQSQDDPGSPTPLKRPTSAKKARPEVVEAAPTSPLRSPSPSVGLRRGRDTLAESLVPSSQSPEKSLAVLLSPRRHRSPSESPSGPVPSSQAFESPIKMRAQPRSLSKKESIVLTSQYFEQSYHLPRSQAALGNSVSRSGSPVVDVPSSQPCAEDGLFLGESAGSPARTFDRTRSIPSSQTQLMSPVRRRRVADVDRIPLSPVKSSQDVEYDLPRRRPLSPLTPTRRRHEDTFEDDLDTTPMRDSSLLRSSSPLLNIASSSSCASPHALIERTVLHATPRVLEEFASMFDEDEDDELPALAHRPYPTTQSPAKGSPARSTQSGPRSLPFSTQSYPLEFSLPSSLPFVHGGGETMEVVRDFCGMFDDSQF